MHFVFIMRIISTKFIVENIFFANDPDHPPGGTAFPLAITTSFFPIDLDVPAGPVSGSVDNSPV